MIRFIVFSSLMILTALGANAQDATETHSPTTSGINKVQHNLTSFAMIDIGHAFSSGIKSFGAMAGIFNDFGAYIKYRDNFNRIAATYECDDHGMSSGDYVWLDGAATHSRTAFTAGGIVHAFGPIYPYFGVGYGRMETFWQMTPTQSGAVNWVRVSDLSHKGVCAELGFVMKFDRSMLSIGMTGANLKFSDIELGVGIAF